MKPHTLDLRVDDRYLQTEAKIFDQIMQILHVTEISYFMALPFVKKKKKEVSLKPGLSLCLQENRA